MDGRSLPLSFLDELNAAVGMVGTIPRVTFAPGLGDVAERWIAKKHADGAVHEPATIAAFLAARRFSCKSIFDIGAHLGYFTLLSVQLFPDAEVTAFEMHPRGIETLQANVWPHVKIVHATISDVSREKVRFWISGFNIFEEPEGGWGNLASIPGAMKPRGINNSGRGFAEVNFLTLDDYCATERPPDLIKIDVEGYQAKAVLGTREMLRRHRPMVIIELHDPEKLARFGTTNRETVQPFFDAGYCGYWCGNHRSPQAVFEPITEMGDTHERLSIAVFIPEERYP